MKHANKRAFTWFGAAVAVMGLLISARLLLVTGHPRRAIADPVPVSTQQPEARPTAVPAGPHAEPTAQPAPRSQESTAQQPHD